MAWLLMTAGPMTGERIEIVDELLIGREQADLTIDDEALSRRHVAIRLRKDGVEVEDLDSKNGTWLDGVRLEAATTVTRSGAALQVGDTVAEIHFDVEPATRERATRVRAPRERPEPAVNGAPAAAVVSLPPFGASSEAAARRRRSAATRLPVATLLCLIAIAATAAALVIYFAGR
jgi:hypothetical protein